MQTPFSAQDIPGVGAMGDTLEFVKKLWSGMQVPGMALPAASTDELEKQIRDLKAVESWLTVNMNMLRGTIQALEVQRATMAALDSLRESFAQQMKAPAADPAAPTGAAWPYAQAEPVAPASPEPAPAPETAAFGNPAAWWNLLQDQFKQALGQALQSDELAPAAPPASPAQPARPARKRTAKPKAAVAAKAAAKKPKPRAKSAVPPRS